MNKIYALTDYKGNFGSKWDSVPYRSGLDKKLISELFIENGYECEFLNFFKFDAQNIPKGSIIIYTSSEDYNGFYKEYIEDVILFIERSGYKVIPGFDFLKAHNNKVYMELLRKLIGRGWDDSLQSNVYGSIEEILNIIDEIYFPIVVKKYSGALSRGVFLAKNKRELLKSIRKISNVKYFFLDLKEYLRTIKHKGYIKESKFRKKFILQQFIPELKNDWKILIYGNRYFILTRHTKKNDFRASGSHINYLAGSESIIPDGIFDYAKKIQAAMNVPHLSLDVVFDGSNFYLTEFQAVYFGTSTVNMSDVFFVDENNTWISKESSFSIEKLYVDGIIWYLNK